MKGQDFRWKHASENVHMRLVVLFHVPNNWSNVSLFITNSHRYFNISLHKCHKKYRFFFDYNGITNNWSNGFLDSPFITFFATINSTSNTFMPNLQFPDIWIRGVQRIIKIWQRSLSITKQRNCNFERRWCQFEQECVRKAPKEDIQLSPDPTAQSRPFSALDLVRNIWWTRGHHWRAWLRQKTKQWLKCTFGCFNWGRKKILEEYISL